MARILLVVAITLTYLLSGHDPVDGAIPKSLAPGAADTGQPERLYLENSAAAMKTMMRDMHTDGSGDVNLDFVAQMVAHHQGAIDMAEAFLRTGDNPQLIRLAHEIVVTQTEEIAAMRLAIAEQPISADKP
jgi:uncharacterized protein (DUF305 family)